MYYATIDNKIGQSESLPANAIEISTEQYKSLMTDKMQGKRVTVENGQVTTYTECYSTTGEALKERDPKQPLITTAPTDGLHKPKWINGKWTEGETAADRSERFEDLRNRKYREIAAARYNAEIAGVIVNGISIKTDRESQGLITGAALKAMQDSTYTCRWKGIDGFVELTAPQIIAVADAVRAHVQSCFDHEAELLPLIESAETEAELDAISW